jgi:acyl carrier protein
MRCKDLGVTTKAVLQLSWAKVLCEELYGQSDVVYGDVVSTVGDLADDDDAVMVGPAINTIPVRIQLGKTPSMDVAEALALVQNTGDCARGENAMASLRRVQAAWKSSALDREHIPASLFQSLFVFDGIIRAEESESNGAAEPFFKPARTRTAASEYDNTGPAYDDYPLIVSFHIKNNTLHGKLRAKMSAARVGELGGRLKAAVKDIISSNLHSPVLDKECMGRLRSRNEVVNGTSKQGSNDAKLNGHGDTASEAVLETVKAVLGSRYKDKVVSYDTRLANIGLDSILAIRLSMMLKKQLGMHISVFDLIKGASVQDIVNGASYSHTAELKPKQKLISAGADLKQLIAEKLALPPDLVKSVQPLMAGQRGHLEQWLHNGKRFYEAPWVYRIEESVDRQRVENCWAELCRAHEILRTTFVWTGDVSGSVQVTLSEDSIRAAGFTVLHEQSKSIEDLIEEHVRERNMTPSDFCKPPARLTLLEAQNGKAVVLRLHHALYDAWSIKMIERDFDTLLALGQVHEIGPSLEKVLQEIRRMRDPDAEDSYWKRHLSHAQDTVLRGPEDDASLGSPLGAHFKVKYSAVVPQSYLDGSSLSRSNTKASAAILLAYARTLQRFTKQSYPTFGLTHASRSLSTTDGMETLDLTSTSLPTLTVTPFCVDLSQQSSSSDNELLGYAQDHLAQLTKFAQADNIERICPKFNSYVNIIHRQHDSTSVANGETAPRILSRYRLEEALASDYFTVSQPSPSTVSAIDGLKTSHLLPHRLFFNVIVHSGQDIKVVVSGDEALFGRDDTMVTKIVSFFGSELSRIARDSVEC